MQRILATCLLVCAATLPLGAQEGKPPSWDARGVGPLPRMGITSLDVSDDGKRIVVGTIAAFGDPNVIVLDDAGRLARTYHVGQQWIDSVAFLPGSYEVIALCTMPAGRAGDRVEAFRCLPSAFGKEAAGEEAVISEKVKQEGPWYFHYGDHSNHPTMKLARAKNATALLAGNQLVIHRKDKPAATLRVPVSDPDTSISLAVDEHGWAVVGTTATGGNNLFLFDPDKQKPVWSRAVNKDVDKAPALEKGLYGTPTLPDGTREELPQRDEKVWAPLSVAIYSDAKTRLIAAADYQGWQRWVRSSATLKDDNQGLRFMPTKPTIAVYDEAGTVVKRFGADKFNKSHWCDLELGGLGTIEVSPHLWRSRGLAGMAVRQVDENVDIVYSFQIANGKVETYQIREEHLNVSNITRTVHGRIDGVVRGSRVRNSWQSDLNKLVPKSPKPWVANARATPIVPGVWQIPGGRVESDLGGQRVIEAPDGLILIEGHAGLSFEREWAAMEAVGLDPKKVKYVLATHEHGDHAPGAYLWRVVTGAKFVCSEEMAYTLQHHIPGNSGYGLHPPVPTDIVIKKDQELDLAGLKVRAIRIPGHTAGSMAWHFEKSGKTFVAFGDLIMPRGVLGYSGSVNFSAKDALSSLRKLHDLKVDYVLPGHGAVEGPANYFQAGIDVGTAVGWGFIKPERPDPRFRITQKNVLVVGFGQQATSAAFGDINGDGKPDVVMVTPIGRSTPGKGKELGSIGSSVVRIFLNHGGKFNETPDHEMSIAVSDPHKVRVTTTNAGPHILIAGKNAALLVPPPEADGIDPKDKIPRFRVVYLDHSDGNHLRFIGKQPLVSRRFGGFYSFDISKEGSPGRKFTPEIDGPYVDFQMVDNDVLTAYGQLFRRVDGKLPKDPTIQLPRDKDWTFLAVGDFNGDGKRDATFLSYGMDKATSARIFYGRSAKELAFADKADAVLPLNSLLMSAKQKQTFPLVRDTPVVADWNGDGIDDLVVAHGQSDEVLVFLGGKDGLNQDRVQRISLEYRVHYEHGVHVGDFNGDGKADLAVFGYTNTGVGAGGPAAVYVWLQ